MTPELNLPGNGVGTKLKIINGVNKLNTTAFSQVPEDYDVNIIVPEGNGQVSHTLKLRALQVDHEKKTVNLETTFLC